MALPEAKAEFEEKTIDLSHNASRFKKSQSDSNLLFNEVDMEEDTDSKQTQNPLNNAQKVEIDSQDMKKQKQLVLKFKKLKTPQGGSQNRIAIKMPAADEGQKKEVQVRRAQAGLLEQRTRSRSGNARVKQANVISAESSSESSQPAQQVGKDLFKALKNLKMRQLEQNNLTKIEESDNTLNQIAESMGHVDNTVAEIEVSQPQRKANIKFLVQNN